MAVPLTIKENARFEGGLAPIVVTATTENSQNPLESRHGLF
ncbi:MAG: hypothetical protein VYA34_09295 [Myxococcota bacterium]|nr:hypothetical protein [Myxococcota bacterium]